LLFEPLGKVGLVNFTVSEFHHYRVGFLFAGTDLPSILLKKDVHQDEGNSFIAIDKGMIPADVESISDGSCTK
jgi:hypothetical protein